MQVQSITVHPQYNSNTMENDFAVWKLKTPVPASASANYACLPSDTTQTFVGTNLTISGWGTLSSNGQQPATMNYAFITGLSNTDCNTRYGGGIYNSMICATDNPIKTDTCQGDSGGKPFT